ncbi:TadE/TadG family type IV pilus assembly protein [Paenibacillus aestuarii]|uniref:TadE/TadG family type IV pilus assembly protein n=1 Tax=Paenibacillus aestuarii TaxID=516965 RepID=A0ABW0K7Z0_9BACL
MVKEIVTFLRKQVRDERGVTDMVVLLIILPIFLFVTLVVITLVLFLMKQSKLEDIHARALQMVQVQGCLSAAIIDDTNAKLTELGFKSVSKDGTLYPSYIGSTSCTPAKVLKDDADPTVRLIIKYPATDLQRLFVLFSNHTTEDPGYFYIDDYGRSEAYE